MSDASAAATSAVRVERRGGVAWLVMDRPPLNVLDIAMMRELGAALDALAGAPPRVVVLTGAGRAFCAGVDVADHTESRVAEMLAAFHGVLGRLLHMGAPVVAAVNGAALGGGCELVQACDIVLARAGAKLGQPEIGLGVFPPAAAALLPRRIGVQAALDLVLTGRVVEAEEARALGLVARVLPADGFEAEVAAYAGKLAGLSAPVVRLAKRAVMDGLERPAAEALARAETLYLDELMRLGDAAEGLAAFLEKRAPVWKDA